MKYFLKIWYEYNILHFSWKEGSPSEAICIGHIAGDYTNSRKSRRLIILRLDKCAVDLYTGAVDSIIYLLKRMKKLLLLYYDYSICWCLFHENSLWRLRSTPTSQQRYLEDKVLTIRMVKKSLDTNTLAASSTPFQFF